MDKQSASAAVPSRPAASALAGDAESIARSINRQGDVVGLSNGEAGFTAVLWPARRALRGDHGSSKAGRIG